MKIAVMGYAGSGKTHVSDCLARKLSVPVLHLDTVKYDKEWKPLDNSVVLPKVKEFMAHDDWIIDGFYDRLIMEERLEKADLIVLLLLPRLTCFMRTLKRSNARRRDGYKNDTNLFFVRFTLFGCRTKKRRKKYAQIVQKYKNKTVVLRSRRQVDKFIENIGIKP